VHPLQAGPNGIPPNASQVLQKTLLQPYQELMLVWKSQGTSPSG
jgi:hypothetical protein